MDTFKNGFEILEGFIQSAIREEIIKEIESTDLNMPKYGIRNADKKFSSIAKLTSDSKLLEKANSYLQGTAMKVRVIFFDKNQNNNWLVAWHQDRTVAVSHEFKLNGWGPWTVKDNIVHVQPPIEVLNQMITFRIHLDSADRNNGCLKVIAGSHKHGIMNQKQIIQLTKSEEINYCEVVSGDVVVMRPHLLHASSKSLEPRNRRVVHIEYSSHELPNGVN